MHTFQSYPMDLLEMNPFTKIGKEWALVSAGNKNKCNTMTVSWGGVGVLWGKNVVYIFIRDSRYTKEFLDNGEFFSLSVLPLLSATIFHSRTKPISSSYAARWLLYRSPKIRSSMMKLCQNGMGIMICILCMSAKLSNLWHAKFRFAALRFNLKRTIPDI